MLTVIHLDPQWSALDDREVSVAARIDNTVRESRVIVTFGVDVVLSLSLDLADALVEALIGVLEQAADPPVVTDDGG